MDISRFTITGDKKADELGELEAHCDGALASVPMALGSIVALRWLRPLFCVEFCRAFGAAFSRLH